jgi:hypothetical protein
MFNQENFSSISCCFKPCLPHGDTGSRAPTFMLWVETPIWRCGTKHLHSRNHSLTVRMFQIERHRRRGQLPNGEHALVVHHPIRAAVSLRRLARARAGRAYSTLAGLPGAGARCFCPARRRTGCRAPVMWSFFGFLNDSRLGVKKLLFILHRQNYPGQDSRQAHWRKEKITPRTTNKTMGSTTRWEQTHKHVREPSSPSRASGHAAIFVLQVAKCEGANGEKQFSFVFL